MAYGSIRVNLVPGDYTLRLNCPDGSPVTASCSVAVNPSLITMPNGETYRTRSNTFRLRIMGNKTTLLNINIQSTTF